MRYEVRYIEETGCYSVIDLMLKTNSFEPFRGSGPANRRASLENERWRCFIEATRDIATTNPD